MIHPFALLAPKLKMQAMYGAAKRKHDNYNGTWQLIT
jgi:hypothetical protein